LRAEKPYSKVYKGEKLMEEYRFMKLVEQEKVLSFIRLFVMRQTGSLAGRMIHTGF
jgi:hypothetical protein